MIFVFGKRGEASCLASLPFTSPKRDYIIFIKTVFKSDQQLGG